MGEFERYLPGLMIAAGAGLQFWRQFKWAPEWSYHVIAIFLGVLAFWIVVPFTPDHWRHWLLACVDFLTIGGGGIAMIWGGTFAASNGAKGIAAANPSAAGLVPITNSK